MRRRPQAASRVVATVMFTDIVRSTELAAELGDRRWKGLVARHNAIVRRALGRYGGRELDTAGDGFFIRFDAPAQAIECATAIIRSLESLGLQIRTAIHTGETEVMGAKVGGIAVHVAARVLGRAAPGQILVTRTVRDLAAGSGIAFEDRGAHELKGVPGEWHLYSVSALSSPTVLDEPTQAEGAWRQGRWRAALPYLLLGAVALAAGLGGALFLALQTRDPPAQPGPNTIVAVDPVSLEAVLVAPVGTQPIGVVEGFDSLWVANFGDRTVQQLDPTTGERERIVALSASGNPSDLAIGGEFVWVASSIDGSVARIDPRTGAINPIEVGVGVGALAFGDGLVWGTNGQTNEVLRIDPRTEQVERVILEGDSQPVGLAIGHGAVWVAEHLAGRIARIDPETMEVVTTIPVRRGQPDRIAIGDDYVWVTIGSDDSVLRIDPATDAATTIEAVGNQPGGIAVDDDAVWVCNTLDGTLARIDPREGAVVDTVELGFAAHGVALAGGRVWVTLGN